MVNLGELSDMLYDCIVDYESEISAADEWKLQAALIAVDELAERIAKQDAANGVDAKDWCQHDWQTTYGISKVYRDCRKCGAQE